MNIFIKISLILFLVFQCHDAHTQISMGGQPITVNFEVKDVPVHSFEPPDRNILNEQDHESASKMNHIPRFAVSVPVEKDLFQDGYVLNHSENTIISVLTLDCPGALGLGVSISDFFLPPGSSLFLYNCDRSHVIGAFTDLNNNDNNWFTTEFVQGDQITLEYSGPSDPELEPHLQISEIAYAYRNLDFPGITNSKALEIGSCHVNVNCSEGDNWLDEKRGVVKIVVKAGDNYYWCTGSFVNNTQMNCYPYILSAAHCMNSATETDMASWMFYLNYESNSCSGTTSTNTKTIIGAKLIASDPSEGDSGSDFLLVLLNSFIPASYNAYLNGWNRSTIGSNSGVCIHHPGGDLKKISTYNASLLATSEWNGKYSHWKTIWSTTTNGHGVSEGGSSGSPAFDSNGRIAGTLSGGFSACETSGQTGPSMPDYFGRMSYHWESNGTAANVQLAPWLDPISTGVSFVDGLNNCGGSVPVANFTVDRFAVAPGGYVTFTDASTNFPSSRIWSFEGGTPSTSAEISKKVYYNQVGTWDVQIISTNNFGKDTVKMVDYITVDSSLNVVINKTGIIKMYPNPSFGRVVISMSNFQKDKVVITLIDDLGIVHFIENQNLHISSDNFILNLRNFSPGTYTLKINSEKYSWSDRIIILK